MVEVWALVHVLVTPKQTPVQTKLRTLGYTMWGMDHLVAVWPHMGQRCTGCASTRR